MLQFALVGLMAVGHAGDLDVTHPAAARFAQVLAQLHRHVTLDDLAVVQVHLYLQIGRADGLHHGMRLVLAVQKEARDVAGVDRLDLHRHTLRRGLLRGPGQVGQVAVLQRLAGHTGRRQASHHMHPAAAQRLGIGQGLLDKAAAELVDAVGQAGQAALAGLEVAGRRVEQCLHQAVLLQLRGQVGRRDGIGKQVLDGVEAIGRSGRKAVDEGVLGVHHRQVGGKTGHGGLNPEVRGAG